MTYISAADFRSKDCTVDRRDLAYIQFILESYEGLAIMSTIDRERGIVRISYPACFSTEVEGLVAALQSETSLQPLAGDRAGHAA